MSEMFGKRQKGREEAGDDNSEYIDSSPIYSEKDTEHTTDHKSIQHTANFSKIKPFVSSFIPSIASKSSHSSIQISGCSTPTEVSPKIKELTRIIIKHRKAPQEHWKAVRTSKKLLKETRIAEFSDDQDIRPYAKIQINGNYLHGLLDSGASISCLAKDAFKTLQQCDIQWKEISSVIQTASGQKQDIKRFADVTIIFQNTSRKIRLYIIPTLSQTLYLGIDFWMEFQLMPNVEEIVSPEEPDSNLHTLNDE